MVLPRKGESFADFFFIVRLSSVNYLALFLI